MTEPDETTGPGREGGGAGDGAGEGHEEPNYLGVWGALFLLTVLEVWVAGLSALPKRWIIILLVGMAIWKALLVALYYMHLKFEPRRLVIVALSPLPLAVILVMAVLQEF